MRDLSRTEGGKNNFLIIDTFISCYSHKAIYGASAKGHIFIAIGHMIYTSVSHLHQYNCFFRAAHLSN